MLVDTCNKEKGGFIHILEVGFIKYLRKMSSLLVKSLARASSLFLNKNIAASPALASRAFSLSNSILSIYPVLCCIKSVIIGKQVEAARVQHPAPDFKGTAVVDGDFKEIKLSDYRGKYLVLFFYPLDL